MSWTVAVDESMAHNYLVAATVVSNNDLRAVEAALAALQATLPGWRHMSNQSDQAKGRIIGTLTSISAHTIVFDGGPGRVSGRRVTERVRRDACLSALVHYIANEVLGDTRLILDLDETQARNDELVLQRAKARYKLVGLNYTHLSEHQEPLILVADAVAWCFAKGGLWPGRLGIAAERRQVGQ